MQATILDITEKDTDPANGADIVLTFRHFIIYLENRIRSEENVKKEFFTYVLKRFTDNVHLRSDLTLEEAVKYKEELTLIYSLMMPVIADEKESYWALSTPLAPQIFYGTTALYNLLRDDRTGEIFCDIQEGTDWEEQKKQKLQMVYSLVLNQLYHLDLSPRCEMVHAIEDKVTGMPRYYRVNIDTRFVQIHPTKKLPVLSPDTFQHDYQVDGHINWERVYELLPLSLFRFEGFSIVTLTDITAGQILEDIKGMLLNQPDYESTESYDKIMRSLRALSEKKEISFDMLPALRVNNRLVFNEDIIERSVLIRSMMAVGKTEEACIETAENYLANPGTFFYSDLSSFDTSSNTMAGFLKEAGIVSYALMPVYYNNKIAGILEAYSTLPGALDEGVMTRVEQATPLLAQLLQRNIEEFETRINAVISNRFTSIQPAVQWKFNEVAFQVMKARKVGKEPLADIYFKDVYPLYGAIDIRNSTHERNLALLADLRVQLNILVETLTAIREHEHISIADKLIFKCKKWESALSVGEMDDEYIKIQDFIDNEVEEFLQYFKNASPGLQTAIASYYEAIDQEHGKAFENRRILEAAMQTINNAVNQYLEYFKDEAQQSYPCYFEKFRTDGVEFDIYIGQSIAPLKEFNPLYLKNIRLSQVTAMAALAKLTHALLPEMGRKLQTTQLIFIHSNSISFRNDEKRFDVEGGYNIRYQVVKKRIDKVHILNTHERLTQPGKIALVYFNKKERDEYIGYINYLQDKQILLDDIEHLELEELQGITGLKAIRVGVRLGE